MWLERPGRPGEGEMVTPSSVLHPILLPPLHPTIFMMYALKEQKSDKEYWNRILRWNRHPDIALLTFLEVRPIRNYLTITAEIVCVSF